MQVTGVRITATWVTPNGCALRTHGADFQEKASGPLQLKSMGGDNDNVLGCNWRVWCAIQEEVDVNVFLQCLNLQFIALRL